MRLPETFRGLSAELPVEIYTRNLPHWRQDGATYFVTFRLDDSVPQQVINDQRIEIRELYRELGISPDTKIAGEHPASEKLRGIQQRHARAVANLLDEGYGKCVLRNEKARAPVVEAFKYHAENCSDVYAYVIMPNHVHALVRPLPRKVLEKILGSVKSFSSRRIAGDGRLWQEESHDTIVRDEEHFFRALDYIRGNPGKAGLRHPEYCLFEG